MNTPTFKQKIGCWLNERWRTELVLCVPYLARLVGLEWQDLCNRNENVIKCSDGIGRICQWNDSSSLTVCRFFPAVGRRLLRHVWNKELFHLASPVSIILPVRGAARLEAVTYVANMMSQMAGPESEILVCEHDVLPVYAREWSDGIRHVWIPATEGEAFNKSKAMNAGARAAKHSVLVLHDADCVPTPEYVYRSLALLIEGWEAVRPLRFLFLLDEVNTRILIGSGSPQVVGVQQNNPGLSTVIRRETYMELGGHDERFEGWGGEDLEFLNRLNTRKLYPGSFLPAMHLWHPPAAQKQSGHYNAKLLESILQEPPHQRIETNQKILGALL